MKRIFVLFAVIAFVFSFGNVFAQEEAEDDVFETEAAEYLTEDDIRAIETELAEDTPPPYEGELAAVEEETQIAEVQEGNEMARLNTSQPLYHLLVLDRIYSPLFSDISGLENITVLYKFLHGKDGYLIAVYKNSSEGPVFPQMPNGSRVLVDFVSVWPAAIQDYINSAAFRRFVTNRGILSALQNLF